MKALKMLFFLFLFFCSVHYLSGQEKQFKVDLKLNGFGAFYTKINSGAEYEKYARTGDYPDIVVDLGNSDSKFIFWTGSSYLPFLDSKNGRWFVDELIKRKGDGDEKMPDRTNAYSVVKIIESSKDQVVIHWRYTTQFTKSNPQLGITPYTFVDEYFYIKPDGTVRRTIKKGTNKTDDWTDPKNIVAQTFKLTSTGIADKNLVPTGKSEILHVVQGSNVVPNYIVKPAAWWKFDEAQGEEVTESIGNNSSVVEGNKSLWRKGISGTALQFDGYFSKIEIPAEVTPKISNHFTLEAWIVIGAYPWSYVPIIQQCDDVPEEVQSFVGEKALLEGEVKNSEDKKDFRVELKKEDDKGFFLGVDGHGFPSFKIRVGNKWEELTSGIHLERRKWYQLVATYSQETGEMNIYIDGQIAGIKKVAQASIELSTKNILIGKGKERRPVDPVRKNTFPDSYSFDGLLDEIKIYDVTLTAAQVEQTFKLYNSIPAKLSNVNMDKRALPDVRQLRSFGGYYTKLKFYDIWDNLWRFSDHPDVVVEFDKLPTKFIFWRGVSYIPMIVNEKNQWYSNEFNETWNKSGGQGCQEPMSDKENYNNHAKIIENTPARVVVQWRFPLMDVNHVMANYNDATGWADWSDWYYYIYPDGLAVKKMHLWTDGERNHEWQESMVIMGPDQHPEQIVNTKDALTMLNMKGESQTYDWVTGPPKNVKIPKEKNIQYVNYTGEYKPVTIGEFVKSNVYNGEITPYAVFPTWNHWPVSQMPSDGRYASFTDRSAHSSLTHVMMPVYKEALTGDKPFYEKLLMEGMLNKKPEELIPVAKSWLSAPQLTNAKGCSGEFDKSQRAYVINLKTPPVSFRIDCSADHPMINACFVIKNWGKSTVAIILIDGKKIGDDSSIKQGVIRDTDGSYTKIIWVEKESVKPLDFKITM